MGFCCRRSRTLADVTSRRPRDRKAWVKELTEMGFDEKQRAAAQQAGTLEEAVDLALAARDVEGPAVAGSSPGNGQAPSQSQPTSVHTFAATSPEPSTVGSVTSTRAANPWNEFQRSTRGSGMSRKELARVYHARRGRGSASAPIVESEPGASCPVTQVGDEVLSKASDDAGLREQGPSDPGTSTRGANVVVNVNVAVIISIVVVVIIIISSNFIIIVIVVTITITIAIVIFFIHLYHNHYQSQSP